MRHICPREADIGQFTIGQVAQFVTNRPALGERNKAAQHAANPSEHRGFASVGEIVIGGCRIHLHFRRPQVNPSVRCRAGSRVISGAL